jgi:hypothetical protein
MVETEAGGHGGDVIRVALYRAGIAQRRMIRRGATCVRCRRNAAAGRSRQPALTFLFLESVHLDRWRGHAFARLDDVEAVEVLTSALERLDPTFARAGTSLRVDLAVALIATGEYVGARVHAERVEQLAIEFGSVRQRHRMRTLK